MPRFLVQVSVERLYTGVIEADSLEEVNELCREGDEVFDIINSKPDETLEIDIRCIQELQG